MTSRAEGKESLPIFLLLYLFGAAGGALFYSLVLRGRIEVKGLENVFRIKSGSLILCNHPSILEPFLIGFLFALRYLRHPCAHRPWSTPDVANFYEKWWYWLLRWISIPITRSGSATANRETLHQMLRIAKGGRGNLVLFVEAGRTCTAEKKGEAIYSDKGNALGDINSSVGNLATRFGCLIPIWIKGADRILPNTEGLDRDFKRSWVLLRHYLMALVRLHLSRDRVVIKVGKPFSIPRGTSGEEAASIISQTLLNLADQ